VVCSKIGRRETGSHLCLQCARGLLSQRLHILVPVQEVALWGEKFSQISRFARHLRQHQRAVAITRHHTASTHSPSVSHSAAASTHCVSISAVICLANARRARATTWKPVVFVS
jgi:hypothetical protein